MINLRITQRTIDCNKQQLIKDAQTILGILGYQDFDLGIWITTDKTIRDYNRDYRGKDKATDIISFPFYPELKAGNRIKATTPDEQNLGDIIISAEYVARDAQEKGTTFYRHLQRMLVHGICHLLGYDHIEDKNFAIMSKKELELLGAIQKNPEL